MIRSVSATIVVAAVVLVTALPCQAQNGVAILDINQLFDRHPTFKAELDKLRTEAESLQASVASERKKLQAQSEQLPLVYAPGSPEFSNAEKSLAMDNARIELDARDRMRDLMRREARLHFDVYGQINDLVSRYCQETRTPMVLRYSPVAAQPNDPEAIMRQVNSEVVWSRNDRDITPVILERLGSALPSTPRTSGLNQ